MSPPCLDFAGNGPPPPTPPHTPFVPGKINNSEELGKGVMPEGERRREGHASPPAPRARVSAGARREGSGGAAGPRGPCGGGRGARPARGAEAGQSCEAAGPGLPHLQVRARGRGSCRGGSRGRRGLRGARRVDVRPRGPGRGAGAGAGVGEAHGEVSPRRRTVFCGRNSLERRQWSGMFTAGGKTISNSSGEMCHPNVTGKL
ncbi:unnamed protein product, partial [Coccothraustes coccothraustes]